MTTLDGAVALAASESGLAVISTLLVLGIRPKPELDQARSTMAAH